MSLRVQLRHYRPPSALMPPRTAAVLAALAALAGCGSALAPAAGPATPSTTTPQALVACVQPALRITLDTQAAGAAAGSYFLPLEFTNASSRPCTLPGYPGVTFARGRAGAPIGAPAVRQKSATASGLLLRPDKVAHAWVQVADIANYSAALCRPVRAAGLRVSLGSDAKRTFLARPFPACGHAVRGSAVLAVFPMQPGRASRGTAP